ncbi:MAG TPA: DUF3794 domain-containing protein [Clostridia bacterium]
MASRVFGLIEVSGLADAFPVNPVNFKQLSVQETLTIPKVKPDVEQIVSVTAEVKIKCKNVINTPEGTSIEGQILTGKKLVVEGVISQKVEYVAAEPTQPVHAVHFDIPFSSYIVLPSTFQPCTPVEVTGYIEDIFVQLLNKRTIFKNVAILLDAGGL